MRNHQVMFSSKSNEYLTPVSIFNPIKETFEIELDPCSDDSKTLDVKLHLTEDMDGLKQSWMYNAFINPPYSDIERWVDKATAESIRNTTLDYVMLLPSRTDRPWYLKLLKNAQMICFMNKRVRFSGMKTGAPFPSILALISDNHPDHFKRDCFAKFGPTIWSFDLTGPHSQTE